ncbi:MAG TPA: hypothetical protein VN039_02720 [Nitrospira sp.]|nr:hypothetical protein [Nitrospira sp.]
MGLSILLLSPPFLIISNSLTDLEAQFKSESEALAAATDPLNEKLETISIKPAKSNIAVKLVTLAWTPPWRDATGGLTPACT